MLCMFGCEDLPVVLILIFVLWIAWKYPTPSLGLVLNVWFVILVLYGSEEEVLGTMWPVWRGNLSGTLSMLHDDSVDEL